MKDVAAIWATARMVLLVLLLGLPAMAGYCWWREQDSRQAGDLPYARSWGDATRSFLSMTIAGWLLLGVAWWAFGRAVGLLEAAAGG